MNYQTYAAVEPLTDFVKCFWTFEMPAMAEPEKQRIVPDGCMEMIFHCGDLYRQWISETKSVIQPRSFVYGQITTSLEIEPTGRSDIFAVRFLPGGFLPFAAIPVAEMENRAVPLNDLFGEEGARLENLVLHNPSASSRITIVKEFLIKKLEQTETADRLVASCVDTLLSLKGQVTIDKLAEKLTLNRRQLERKFSTTIGLSPKQLAKIIRLQSALELMSRQQFNSLTSLAYETGYFDQAHFIKDFKEFTGVSPKQFYDGNLKMAALFSGAD